MMAAAQPFISGAISKTINMPHDATVEDCKEAYELSLAARRQGQRPLPRRLEADASRSTASPIEDDEDLEEVLTEAPVAERVTVLAEKIAEKIVYRRSSSANRRRLPDRRAGYTQKARIGNHKIYLRTGEYEDGRSARSSSTCTRRGPPSAA